MASYHDSFKQTNEDARLQALPEEIIDNIAHFAQTDVLPLRRTCRGIQEKSFHAFLKNCIAARSVWVNRESLQNLEDVANSERLGQHVRKVIIINHEWDPNMAERLWGDGSDLDEHEEASFNRFHHDHSDQIFLQRSGYVTMCLARAFAKMKGLDTVIMFPVESHADMEPSGRLVWRNIPGVTHSCSPGFVNTSWFTLCQAIISSGWRPKCLEAGIDCDNQLGPEAFASLIGPQRTLLARTFDQLDRLHLGFKVPRIEPQYRHWCLAFPKFLEICGNVSDLCLQVMEVYEQRSTFDVDEDLLYPNVESWPTFPNLKTIDLWFLYCDSAILLEFLAKHPKLKKILLVELRLTGEDHWRMFLEAIGANFDLDELAVTMDEDRHGIVEMLSATRPGIQQAIEDRVREGIFCYKCTRRDGIGLESADGLWHGGEMHAHAGSSLYLYEEGEDYYEVE